MTDMQLVDVPVPARLRGRLRACWPTLATCAAAIWSGAQGVLGLCWWTGSAGYPFAPAPLDRMSGSPLEGADVATVAPAMVTVGVLGVIAAVLMQRKRLTGVLRRAVLGFAAVSGVTFVAIVPDYTALGLMAIWPALLVFAFTGVPGEQGGLEDILYWHRVYVLLVFVGGLLWATAGVAAARRTKGRCVSCGRRGDDEDPRTNPVTALRWGRRAVWMAVLATVPYDVTRLAWFAGVPLGISDDFLHSMQQTPGMLEVGATLAVMSCVGAILTHGLVAGWGERFPRWLPVVGGRDVPPRLAIVPAGAVAVVLPPAGLMQIESTFSTEEWGATAPMTLWLLWAAGLAVATYSYYLRRRTTCMRCGRGRASAPSIAELRSSDHS
ncbi:NYN domain-containing protein [Kribbella sp. NPDC023855]|uniref:NYN domain-containing protein n=1 Tax=Kribbella sp. NPDC023855 TaxID=3154698 RepID=UPI0033C8FCF0